MLASIHDEQIKTLTFLLKLILAKRIYSFQITNYASSYIYNQFIVETQPQYIFGTFLRSIAMVTVVFFFF